MAADSNAIVVIDDEESMREGCRQTLQDQGYCAGIAGDGERGLELVERMKPRVVLVDLKMPGMSGMEVIRKVRQMDPDIRCIVITGFASIESALEAMKSGAHDYLCKPFDDTRLLQAVESGLGTHPNPRIPETIPNVSFTERRAGETPSVQQAFVPAGIRPPDKTALAPAPAPPERHFFTPREVADEVVSIGKAKCAANTLQLTLLGILAGVYIGFGAQLCTMVTHDATAHIGTGLAKFVGGSVFTVGLMFVVLAGAELFTGNCLILTAVLTGGCTTRGMMRNWAIVYIANFAGSLLLAAILYECGLWKTGSYAVGAAVIRTAAAKVNLSFSEAFFRGIACNWLVCLAIWLAVGGRDTVSKIFGIYFPIMAFVASGFEHSVANMYFIPAGLLLASNKAMVDAAGLAGVIEGLTWSRFLIANLLPVTLGNIAGGALFVGASYYFAYLRKCTVPSPANGKTGLTTAAIVKHIPRPWVRRPGNATEVPRCLR
jgi:formate transporter